MMIPYSVTTLYAYQNVGRVWGKRQLQGSRHMVILQRGLIVVGHSQRVRSLDQEVIVEASVLEVMRSRRPHGAEKLYRV